MRKYFLLTSFYELTASFGHIPCFKTCESKTLKGCAFDIGNKRIMRADRPGSIIKTIGQALTDQICKDDYVLRKEFMNMGQRCLGKGNGIGELVMRRLHFMNIEVAWRNCKMCLYASNASTAEML